MSLDIAPAPALSVVVPCYNEMDNLRELHQRLTRVCRDLLDGDYEIVLVNDGSSDKTWPIMLELAQRDTKLVLVNLSRNYGHQLALSAGLQMCRGRRAFIIDADMQDPPELLPDMMKRMDRGFDVVFGRRITRDGETKFKRASAAAFYRLLGRLTDIDIPLDAGDFRLMSRRSIDILNAMPESSRFIRGMVSWIGLPQEAFAYERAARFAGQTKYPFAKMVRFALDAITGFSIRPLRLASYLGLAAGGASLLLLVYVIGSYLRGDVVQGWTSLTVIILIVSAAQLLMIGLLGEYLGRLYMESKRRPLFVIQDVVRGSGFDVARLPTDPASHVSPAVDPDRKSSMLETGS